MLDTHFFPQEQQKKIFEFKYRVCGKPLITNPCCCSFLCANSPVRNKKKINAFHGDHRHCFVNRTITVFQKRISLHTEEAEKDLCRCRPALKLLPAWSNWVFNQSFLELKTAFPSVLLMVPGLWCTAGRCFSVQNQFLSVKDKALILFEQGALWSDETNTVRGKSLY